MRHIGKDLRFAIRVLARNPGFALVAVLTLALGIAANATVFGWIDTVLLHPIPGAANASELAALEAIGPDGRRVGGLQHPDFRDYQREMTLAAGVTASHNAMFTVGEQDHARRVMGQVVSANYFAVLGVQPHLGRMLSPQEDLDTPGASPYAVVSYRLFQDQFHGDPRAVGRPVRINGFQYTLVGVTRPGFSGTLIGVASDVWVPLSMILKTGTLNTWAATDRNARFLNLILRRKPGVTVKQAGEEARAVAARIAAAYPDTHRKVSASVVPMWRASSGLQSALGRPLRILMAACILVLLIACANVTNLLMARTVSRRREFGIRVALGAGRRRILQQVLCEILLLSAAGALLGLLLAQWMGASLFYALPSLDAPLRAALDPMLNPRPSAQVWLFTALAALGAALASAIIPALYAGRVELNESLKEGGRGSASGVGPHRARAALVMLEVALSSVALIGAGLAVRSFQKLARLDLGFEPDGVVAAHFHLSTNAYPLARERQFNRDLRLLLEASGFPEVAYADSVPLSVFGPSSERVQSFGPQSDDRGVTSISRSIVSPGYFRLMRIPLLEGRDFTERDEAKSERVILVNRAFAERYFAGLSPLGRKVRVSGAWCTIIGMVADSKTGNPAEAPRPFFYGVFPQMFYSGHNNFFFVRARDLDASRAALRRAAATLDPNRGLYDLSTVAEYTEAGLFGERVAASVLSALALLALALSAAGLYSVMAYAVSERTKELGIRMALGARRGQVLALMLGKGLAMAAPGLAAGVLLAFAGTGALSHAFGSPVEADPAVFAAAALALLCAALLASYIPAYRAVRIDPMNSLRSE